MRKRAEKLKMMGAIAPHHGSRIAFLRRLFKLTQNDMGQGSGYSQQDISDFEAQAVIIDEALVRLLKPLDITLERFKDMDEGVMGQMVFNMAGNQSAIGHFGHGNTNQVNPIEELLKQVEEIKAVYKEQIDMLKDMLQSKDADIAKLEARIDKLEALIAEKDQEIKALLAKLSGSK